MIAITRLAIFCAEKMQDFQNPRSDWRVIVHRIMVMHHNGSRTQKRKDVVFIQSSPVFFCVGLIERDAFVTIKAKAAAGCVDEYDRIVPKQQGGVQAILPGVSHKTLQLFRVPFLQFCKESFARRSPMEQSGEESCGTADTYEAEIEQRKSGGL